MMILEAKFDIISYLWSNIILENEINDFHWEKENKNYVTKIKFKSTISNDSYYENYFVDGEKIENLDVEFKGILKNVNVKDFISYDINNTDVLFDDIKDLKINNIKFNENQICNFEDKELLKNVRKFLLEYFTLKFNVDVKNEIIENNK